MECFNCFQRGFCGYGLNSPSGKVLRFCSKACADVQRTEHALYMVEKDLIGSVETLKRLKNKKTDIWSIPAQKLIFTQMLLFKSLKSEKSKKELNRLLDLFKDQLSDMLTLIGDNSSEKEMLDFAEKMKQVNKYMPILIQILGTV